MWWLLGALFLLDQEERVSRLEAQARLERHRSRKPRRLTKKDREAITEEVRLLSEAGLDWPIFVP